MLDRYLEKEGFSIVPISGNRYSVDINGNIIYNDEKSLIETTLDENGDIVAWLYLWNGWENYQVATLIAHTFKPVYVPFSKWNQLSILFIDGNKQNIHASNLIWKFPIGLEHKAYPGYAFIPGCSRYIINKEGEIIQYLFKKILPSSNLKGYQVYSLKTDLDNFTLLGRHRALCLAWKDYPVNVDKLHVNHINGIKGSDDLDNLEWITPKGNIYHALRTGLKPDGKEIIVRNVTTGEIKSFYTEAEANQQLGFSRGTIRRITNFQLKDRKIYKGYDIRLVREGVFWNDVELDEHFDVIDSGKGKSGEEDPYARKSRDDSRVVLVRNAKTKEIIEYRSLAVCAKAVGYDIPTIHHRLENKNTNLFNDYLQFKDKEDNSPWIDYTEEELTKFTNNKDYTVLVRNVKTGLITEYCNLTETAKTLSLDVTTILRRLEKVDQPIFPGYLQFQYKTDFKSWREPEDLELENDVATYDRIVLAKNVKTGAVLEYPSARQCAFALGLSELTVAVRLRNNEQKVYNDGYQFKLKSDNTPWRIIVDLDKELKESKLSESVSVRNIFTNEVTDYQSISEASRSLNIPTYVIIDRKDNVQKWPYFQYEFKFGSKEWAVFNDRELKMFKRSIELGQPFRGRGFVLTDIETGEETLYPRRKELVELFDADKTYISSVASKQTVFRDKWRIKYFFN
jgi:hypothetical protein